VAFPAGVPGRAPGLADEGVGDEPGAPHLPGGLDPCLSVARACGLGEQALPGGGECGVGEELAGARCLAAREVDVRRRGPLRLEQLAHGLDGLADALHGRVAVLGVADGVRQHLVEGQGAVVAQQQHPGVERARYGDGERPGAGDEVQAEAPVVRDGRPGRRDALPAQHPYLAAGRGEEDRHLTGRAVEVRLDDVQHEGPRHGRVVGVAAALQNGHRRLRGEPVGGGDHAEGALEGRSGREHRASHLVVCVYRPG
jgi:hypothetical protein